MKISKKMIGYILLVGGVMGIIFFLAADLLGIGNDPSTIGWKQLLGAGVGLIVVLAGIFFLLTKKNFDFLESTDSEENELI